MSAVSVAALDDRDRDWVRLILSGHWGGPEIVTRGAVHQGDQLPGFKALINNVAVGLLTYRFYRDECEIISLNSMRERLGIGTMLMTTVCNWAASKRCHRVWLITTNDNSYAVKFYEKLGFRIAAIHENALLESRKLKPSIPMLGFNGIEIRDEIEMELLLHNRPLV